MAARENLIRLEGDAIHLGHARPRHSLKISDIAEIAIYKRDEIVTDLVCCDVSMVDGQVWTAHEELLGFENLIAAFERLPGFDTDWRDKVIKPAFAENRTIVFSGTVGR